jgi:hypothetical protein
MKIVEVVGHGEITNIAKQYQNQFETGHVATGPASRFKWRYEPTYPLSKIAYQRDAIDLFRQDQQAWTEEGEPDRYDDLLNEPIRQPIILVEVGTLSYIWDGNHRVAASLLTNRHTIPAYVGIPLST